MKYSLVLMAVILSLNITAQTTTKPVVATSPLAAYSSEWSKPVYSKCNTAETAIYMTQSERDVIFILNIMRTYPAQFADDVLRKYPDKSGKGWLSNIDYYESLMDTLFKLKPVNLLMPEVSCYTSAECHAASSGAKSYVGHVRQSDECAKKRSYNAECCDYGHNKALDIVMALLIDEGVPSLGHRWACIESYKKIGVSIKPHTTYRYNTVLDFSF